MVSVGVTVVGAAVLVIVIAGAWVTATVAGEVALTLGPLGGVPVTVPRSEMVPASRSAWLTV